MSEVDDNLNYMLGQLSLVVSEFNQVRVASILGCGPATHLGELKQDIEKEYKERNEAKGGIEMVIKSDSITHHVQF